MEIMRKSSFGEIEKHLVQLGAGNHEDNVESLIKFKHFYEVKLSKDEYFEIVFLADIKGITPKHMDRRLKVVAERALELIINSKDLFLQGNWDLSKLQTEFIEKYGAEEIPCLPNIVIRDTRCSEKDYGARWYIQDGCHRALAYAISIIKGEKKYYKQKIFLATEEDLKVEE